MPTRNPPHPPPATPEPWAFDKPAAATVAGVELPAINKAIKQGDLTARQVGSTVIILADELRRWLHALPLVELSDLQMARHRAVVAAQQAGETA